METEKWVKFNNISFKHLSHFKLLFKTKIPIDKCRINTIKPEMELAYYFSYNIFTDIYNLTLFCIIIIVGERIHRYLPFCPYQ